MNLREQREALEYEMMSEFATKSAETRGRATEEDKCEIRTEFQRDRDRIIHAKSFRRLMHKTQVFLSPEGDHYRTRLTHTLEVSQISRTIARALKLNEDLTEAIALGHDLGHTPFGHCGEEELNKIHEGGFQHNLQSLRVVDHLEKRSSGRVGLNLTDEVRDGIVNHNGPVAPYTLEGQIVKICDRIAYINHDIDDAFRAKVLTPAVFPVEYFQVLGVSHSKRINTLIMDVISNSMDKNEICMSEDVRNTFNGLRTFMFKHVYLNLEAKKEEQKAREIVRMLYEHFKEKPMDMPEEMYTEYLETGNLDPVKDYVAGMSDRYAVQIYKDIFIPQFWK